MNIDEDSQNLDLLLTAGYASDSEYALKKCQHWRLNKAFTYVRKVQKSHELAH